MKKTLLCIIMFAVMSATAVGQTQQGYVKTRGKLAADGKNVVPGVRLSNALVTIENRSPVKSGTNGAFSFALPAGTNHYRLQRVELMGYTLADPDAVRQMHTYSKDLPFIVVLEDMKQREADLEAARKSVRNVMKREIRKKQDELDSLRDAHAITQAKYDSLVRDFWEYRQSSEKLVNEMAERYVSTDYDQLDDFNRQVQAYIESGQLTKADSMIRSKGSLEERFNRVKQYEATNAQRETEIQQQQEALDKSRQYTQKEKDDLANDLYRQCLIFLQQPLMQDSALYCLKMRADLDTSNLNAVWDYSYLSQEQKHFTEAEKYYLIHLRGCCKHDNQNELVETQNNLGALYCDLHDYAQSERFLLQVLGHYEKLYAVSPDAYRADLARTQNGLGVLYFNLHDYVQSEYFFRQALGHREKLYDSNPDAFRADLASTYNNLGNLYYDLHDYTSSESYYILAETLFSSNLDANFPNFASIYNNLGNLYYELHDFASSALYFRLALESYEKLFAVNPDAYRDNLATTQCNIGNLYRDMCDYANSEKFLKMSLENLEILCTNNPNAYLADLASVQNSLGNLYRDINDYFNCERYYKLALKNYEILFVDNPEIYRKDIAITQNNLGGLYSRLNDYSNSELFYKLAMENLEKLYSIHPDAYCADLASIYNNMGNLYSDIRDYTQCEKYYKLALGNFEKLSVSNPNAYLLNLANTQNDLGLMYKDIHDYASSEKYLKQALLNKEKLFSNNPDFYRADLSWTQNNLGILYRDLHDYINGEQYLKQALENKEILFKANPEIYRADIASTQYNLGLLYSDLQDYKNSELYYKLALANKELLYINNPDYYRENYAMTYWSLMLLYAETGQYEKYDTFLAKTLELYKVLFLSDKSSYKQDLIELQNRSIWRMLIKWKVDEALSLAKENYVLDTTNDVSLLYLAKCLDKKAIRCADASDYTTAISIINEAISLLPNEADFYDTKGAIMLLQGDERDALKIWKKVLKLNPKFLDDYPKGTYLSNGLKAKGLIK